MNFNILWILDIAMPDPYPVLLCVSELSLDVHPQVADRNAEVVLDECKEPLVEAHVEGGWDYPSSPAAACGRSTRPPGSVTEASRRMHPAVASPRPNERKGIHIGARQAVAPQLVEKRRKRVLDGGQNPGRDERHAG